MPKKQFTSFAHLLFNSDFSVADFAKKVGISVRYVQALMQGTRLPSLGVATRIARALGITIEKVFPIHK